MFLLNGKSDECLGKEEPTLQLFKLIVMIHPGSFSCFLTINCFFLWLVNIQLHIQWNQGILTIVSSIMENNIKWAKIKEEKMFEASKKWHSLCVFCSRYPNVVERDT